MDKFEQLLEYRTPIKDNDNKLLGKYWKPGSKYWHHKMFHLSISVTRQQCCQCRANSNLKQGKWEIGNSKLSLNLRMISHGWWDPVLDINWSDRSQSKPGLISNPSPLRSVQHLLSIHRVSILCVSQQWTVFHWTSPNTGNIYTSILSPNPSHQPAFRTYTSYSWKFKHWSISMFIHCCVDLKHMEIEKTVSNIPI